MLFNQFIKLFKKGKSMKNNLINILTVCLLSGALFACNGDPSGQGASNGGGDTGTASSLSINATELPITVDTSSYIPLFEGIDTNVGVYIRNDSDVQINNIAYKLETNSDNNASSVNISISSEQCSTITAHGSCYLPLSIIGNHSFSQTKFSENLSIVYNDGKGKNRRFNDVLNFQYVDQDSAGVFATPLVLSNFGNKKDRGVVYLYATGKSGTIYNITDLKLGNTSLNIDSANIVGYELAAGQVQAIELSGTAPHNNWGVDTLSVAASTKAGNQYKSSAEIVLKPRVSNEIFAGNIPVFDSSISNGGKAYFQNTGSNVLAVSGVKSSNGITIGGGLDNCSLGQKLQPGEGCTVYFSLTANSLLQKNGNGEIELSTSNNALSGVASITWYKNLKNSGAVVFTPVSSYWLGDGVQTLKTVTLTNISESDIHDLQILQPSVSSGISVNIDKGTCGDTLQSGKGCTYYATIVANGIKSLPGYIKYKYKGNYDAQNSVKSTNQVSYMVRSNQPTITINQDVDNLSVSGNGTDSSFIHLTVTNSGGAVANINNIGLQNSSIITEDNSSCSGLKSLDPGASCITTIKFGPIATKNTESGSASYSVAGNFDTVSINIPYVIINPDSSITLAGITASGQGKGDGSKTNPYLFLGSSSSIKSLTLDYTNKSNVTQVINSILNSVSNSWKLDTANSSCLAGNPNASVQLSPGSTCSIKFENVFNQVHDNSNPVINSNLILPTLNIKSGNSIINQQPQINGSGIVYAVNEQATVINRVRIIGNGSLKPVMYIDHTLTNAGGYNKISVTSTFNNDKFIIAEAKGNCKVSANGNSSSSQCDLTVDGTVSELFPINTTALKNSAYQLAVNFSSSIVASSTIGMNIWNGNYFINQIPYKGYYIVPNKYDSIGTLPQIIICPVDWDGTPSNCANQTLDGNFPDGIVFRGTAVYNQYLYVLTGSSVTVCPINPVSMRVEKCSVQNIAAQIAGLEFSQSSATILGDKFYWVAPVNGNAALLVCSINHDSGSLESCKSQSSLDSIYSYITVDYAGNRAYILQSNSSKYLVCSIDTDNVFTNCNANTYPQGFNPQGINQSSIVWGNYLYDFSGSLSASCSINNDGLLGTCKSIARPVPFDNMLSAISVSDNQSGRIMFINFYDSPTYLGTAILNNGDVTDWQNLGLFKNTGSYFGVYFGI